MFSFPQASCSPNRWYIEKPVTPVGNCCTRYRMPRIRAWYSGSVRMLRLEDIQNGPGYRKHPSHLGFKPTAGEESQGARVNSLSEKGMAADLLNPYLCDSSHRPTITLPKKYQPLPPAPPEISAHFSPRHGFPEVQRGLR